MVRKTDDMDIEDGNHILRTKLRMYLSVFLSSSLMITQGTTAAWTSPMLKKLNGTDDNPLGEPLSLRENSWLAAIRIPGILLGAITFGFLARKLGRKTLLLLLSVPPIVFFFTMAFAKTYALILFAKLLDGLQQGGNIVVFPMYLGEIAEPRIRGKIFTSMEICKNIGIVITYCIGPYMTFRMFHLCLAVLPMIFLVCFSVFGLESPYYVLLEGNAQKAERVLRELRGRNDVSKEFEEMKRGVQKSNASITAVFKTRATRRALIIGVGLSVLMMLTGDTVLMPYTQFIFDAAGGTWEPEINTIIVGISQLTITIFSFIITDRFGRKPHLAVSYAGLTVSLTMLGTFFVCKNHDIDVSNFNLIPLIAMIGYFMALYLGIKPLLMAVNGELFPLKVKGVAIAFCTICSSFTGFTMTFSFQTVQMMIGLGETFWILGGFGVCATIFVLVVMIETRGKTLEEIQDELSGKRN